MPTYQLPSDQTPLAHADNPWLRPPLVASKRELVAAILLFVGPFSLHSMLAAWQGSSKDYIAEIMSDHDLLTVGAVESAMLALFFGFVRWRKWTTADFKLTPTGWSTLQAPLLLLAMMAANMIVVLSGYGISFALQSRYSTLNAYVFAHSAHLPQAAAQLSWVVLFAVMILNAFFEELICMGYIFNQLAARKGPAVALILTVALRASCHAYQGGIHMAGIAAAFTVSGIWYWKTRNLWPLVVSHALLDIGSGSAVKVLSDLHLGST